MSSIGSNARRETVLPEANASVESVSTPFELFNECMLMFYKDDARRFQLHRFLRW